MKIKKENKGITLIALIITIIVLLILAVVTITAVNEGNIFAHANNAVTRYNVAATEENTMISNYLTEMAKYDVNNNVETSYYEAGSMVFAITNSSLKMYMSTGDGKFALGDTLVIKSIIPTPTNNEIIIWYNDEMITLNSWNSKLIISDDIDDAYIYNGNMFFVDPTEAVPEDIDNEIPAILVPNFDTSLLSE